MTDDEKRNLVFAPGNMVTLDPPATIPTIRIPCTLLDPGYVPAFLKALAPIAKEYGVNIDIVNAKCDEFKVDGSVDDEKDCSSCAHDCESCNHEHEAAKESVCGTCDCKTCTLVNDITTCPVRYSSCEDCNGQYPFGVEYNEQCPLITGFAPVQERLYILLDACMESYKEHCSGPFRYTVMHNAIHGRLAVSWFLEKQQKSPSFTLELHYDRCTESWSIRLPRNKKIWNIFAKGTPEANVVRKMISFAEEITGQQYQDFLDKYKEFKP